MPSQARSTQGSARTLQVENFLKALQLDVPEFRSSSGSAPELEASCSVLLPGTRSQLMSLLGTIVGHGYS